MNDELTKKLLDDFPKLYRNRHETSMQNGFRCGDGWFDLIYKLSRDIEAVAGECGINPDSPEWPWCRGVKEKLGSLRFRVFAVDEFRDVYERIVDLIQAASAQSLQVCEECGAPGVQCDRQLRTLCTEHAGTSQVSCVTSGVGDT